MLWRPSTGQLSNIDLFNVSNRNTRKKVWNLFKVNGKDTRTTSLTLDVENIGLGRLRICKFGFLSNHFYYFLKDQYFQHSMLLPFFCCLNFKLILHLVFSSWLWVFICLLVFTIFWDIVKLREKQCRPRLSCILKYFERDWKRKVNSKSLGARNVLHGRLPQRYWNVLLITLAHRKSLCGSSKVLWKVNVGIFHVKSCQNFLESNYLFSSIL